MQKTTRTISDASRKRRSDFMKKNPLNYWLGKKRGAETPEWRDKISSSLKNKHKSDEHKNNISLAKIGRKNPSYKDGTTLASSGHMLVLRRDHPFCNSNGRVLEHRLVMEEHIGRYLEKYEHIHHVDGNPLNNNINNLYITTASGNSKAHRSFERLLTVLFDEGIVVFNREKGEYERRQG